MKRSAHKSLLRIATAGLGLVGSVAVVSAQEFAVEPLGIHAVNGASTDGNFTITHFGPTDLARMSDGTFAVMGGVRILVPAGSPPLPAEELIVNGSFEDISTTFAPTSEGLMTLRGGSSIIPGWTIRTGEVAWMNNTNIFMVRTPYGDNCVDLTGYFGPNAALTQTIATRPGQSYRLSLSLGSDADYPGAGGTKAVTVCAGSASTLFTFFPTNTSGNQWKTFTFSFDAATASTEIVIYGISPGIYLGLDNVSVVPDNSAAHSENHVMNGSFEMTCPFVFVPDANGVMSLQPGSASIPGWTTTTAELAWAMNANRFGPSSPHGALFLDLTGYHDSPPYGGILQSIPTTPGQSYRLSFSLGADQDISAYSGAMTVGVSAGSLSNSFTFTPQGEGNRWGDFTMPFTASSSSTVLAFAGLQSGGGQYLGLDNISVLPGSSDTLQIDLTMPAAAGGSLQLNFISQPGQKYAVQSSEDLVASAWTLLPGTERIGTGKPIQVNLPKPLTRQRFYRLQVGP